MWVLKVGGLFTLVFGLMLLGYLIARFKRRRTIEACAGTGVNDALTVEEAALLMGLHPGTLMAVVAIHLQRLGLLRVSDQAPVTIEWTGTEPADELERSFRAAFDEEGHLEPAGTVDFFDALYNILNAKMVPFSGRRTTLYYEHMATELWKQMKAGGEPEPAVFPWMLLLDGTDIWEEIGEGEGWRDLKRMYRVKQRFQADLLRMKEITAAAKAARNGFFKYRDDLLKHEYRSTSSRWAGDSDGPF